MTYTINNNTEKNGIEITFDGKPSEEIRTALKANGFRWHSANHYWYGRADESTVRAILDGNTVPTSESLPTQKKKSASALPSLWERTRIDSIPEHDTRLDTKTICAEVRAHLKARFPECKFSIRKGGYESIYACIEAAPYSREWIPEDADAVREYGYCRRFCAHWEDSPALAAVLAYCDAYLQSYNYDNSDIMTDYFDVNFYGDFAIDDNMDQLTPSAEILADIADFEARAADQAEKDAAEAEEAARRAAIEAEAARIAAEEESRILAEQAERVTAAVEVRDLPEDARYIVGGLGEARKACTLEEAREQIATSEPLPTCEAIISREIYFSDATREEFEMFCLMLLHDFSFVSGFGGSCTFDSRVTEENCMKLNKEQRGSVKWYSCNCIAVYFNGLLQFVIDPQGYSYCRYILIPQDNSCAVRFSAAFAEQLETARTESLPPFYFPAPLAEQAKEAVHYIGHDCTLYYLDPNLLIVRRVSGRLLECTPCHWAQYADALKVTISGAQPVYIRPNIEAFIIPGIIPHIPEHIARTPVNDLVQINNLAGMHAREGSIRAIEYYISHGFTPVIDTIQR